MLQVVPLRPSASLVLVEHRLSVDEVLGVRRRLVWKGLEVDADHRSMTPLELVTGRGRELLRLSGLEGSFQEARILRGATGEDSVSAVTIVQEAHARGISVLQLTPASAPDELATLQTSPEVRREVEDQLARGREVVIPGSDSTIRDWSGTGFIARDPATDEGAYLLSGLISGGQTVVSPGSWTDQALVDRLRDTNIDPTEDTSLVARILKANPDETDLQQVVVGTVAPKALAVYVTTLAGRPVRGARVVFRAVTGSAPGLAAISEGPFASSVTMFTDGQGLARAWARPDTNIAAKAIVRPGVPNDVLLGLNEIMAETENGRETIALPLPFVVLGKNDAPAKIELPCSMAQQDNYCYRSYPVGMQLGQSLWARVLDRFGNVVPNARLAWKTEPPAGTFLDLALVTDRAARVLDPKDPAQAVAIQLFTGTDGFAVTDFIPAREGRIDLLASARDQAGQAAEVGARYTIEANAPAAGAYAFRMRGEYAPTFDGVYRNSFQAPVGGQVLRWTGNPDRLWEPLTGDEPGIARVHVSMRVIDESQPQAIQVSSEVVEPLAETIGPGWAWFDDARTAAFWPQYVVDGGNQRNEFAAAVVLADGREVRCEPGYVIPSRSRRASAETFRILPGFEEKPTDEYGYASQDDLAVAFKLRNPAAYPIYARIVQEPSVAGEQLVAVPPPDQVVRHPTRPDLIKLMPLATTTLTLPLMGAAHGGLVRAEFEVPEPFSLGGTVLLGYGGVRIRVAPPDVAIRTPGGELRAQLTLPVRNFESTVREPGRLTPSTETEPPIVQPAGLEFRVKGQAQVEVTAGGSVVAAASVTADQDGNVIQIADRGDAQAPMLMTAGRSLLVRVPPEDPTVKQVKVVVTDALGHREESLIPFETVINDMGALPVGHTLVRDVSVVDGHLVKQFSDISVKGRGPGLTFARTYSSRVFEATPLGSGWTHSYRSWTQLDLGGGKRRWIVYGGEGTGQVFDCTSGTCRNQRGFHGTLREETTGSVVYTSRSGVEYRYRRHDAASNVTRYWLTEIVDPVGNTVTLQYGTQGSGGEVTRVYEPGNRRVLELSYACAAGADHPQLAKLELRSNPTASTAPDAELAPIDKDGVCIAFGYDGRQNLASVERHRDGCKGEPLRVERFEYVLDGPVATRNNLRSYTDPNGHVTAYTWYRDGDTIEGESQFLVVGDKVERVMTVVEPAPGGTTLFEYVLVPKREAVLGDTQLLYETKVTGPRSGASTVYHLDGYGASARVERALSPARKALSSTRWDPKDVVPLAMEDARGRRTTLRYDDRGNVVERRTATPVLFDTSGASATEPLVDGDGSPLVELIERFGYDAEFGGETCRVDAEGRVTTSRYVKGLLVERRAYATVAPQASLQAAQTCDAVAAGVPTSQRDQVAVQLYCGVNGTCTAAGSLAGDLVKTTSGTRQAEVVAYDAYGYASEQRVLVDAGHTINASSEHDARGRVSLERDDLGHETEHWFDDLDRQRAVERRDGRDDTPDEYRTFAYYPGGELREEKLGIRADPGSIVSRSVTLNGLNRPETVTETAAHIESQVTRSTYDAAGNLETTTDRRGVRKTTVFDLGDRPQQVWVDIADAERFGMNGGDAAGLAAPRLVSTFEYDAAGNKVAETDLHGHRTEYALDPLYRVVQTKGPSVPGPDIGGPSITYKTARRYDRVGNKVYEQDGNGNATRWSYDFANRVLEVIDAVGRFQRNAFDANGDLEAETHGVRTAPGGAEKVQLVRTSKGHDGLGRSLGVLEELADIDGAKRSLATSLAYDDVAHTIEERDRRGAVTVRRLDGLGRVYEEVVDASTTSRLSRALPASAGPALALATRSEYDAGGRRIAVVDPLGRRTEEHFDGLGRVFERRRPMAVFEQFAHDGDGRVISARDGRGIERRTRYDAFGRATEETLVESVTSGGTPLVTARRTYVDLPEDTQVQEHDALLRQTTRHLDGLHREWKTELTGVPVVETRYDAVNKRAARDQKGYVTDWVYDEANRVRAQRDLGLDGARRYEQSWGYDDLARTETWVDRRGMSTATSRDALGRVRRVVRSKDGLAASETTAYDENGNVTRVVDPNVHATALAYDGANRKVSETRASNTSVEAKTSFTYDAAGNRTETKGPRGDWAFDLRETYDDLDRPVRTEVPTGKSEQPYAVTSRAFDAMGNKLCEKRPLGGDPLVAGVAGKTVEDIRAATCGTDQVTRFTYDELSKLTSVVDAIGGEHSFVYDGVRNLLAKQDANGNLTTYTYDALNRRTDEWQHLDAHARIRSRDAVPDGAAEGPASPATEVGALHWHLKLDANGNPEERTDPRGVTVVSTYGALNRLETVTYPAPGLAIAYPYPISTAYLYDGSGNVEKVTERKQVSADAIVEEVTDPEYDGLGRLVSEQRYDGKIVRYEYDAKGNRKKVTDPDQVATEYGYDALDRLETATTPAGEASYRYWPDGLREGHLAAERARGGALLRPGGRGRRHRDGEGARSGKGARTRRSS